MHRGCTALLAALCCLAVLPGVASAAFPTLYVGDAKEYSVAFKAEEGNVYVVELAGAAHCYFTEPHEDLGPAGFSVFPAPEPMRKGPNGFVAEGVFGNAYVEVRASLGADAVSGDFSFDESEESFHCDTGFSRVPFEAGRYEPIGSPGAALPKADEDRAYYGSEAAIEVFLRASGGEAGGIRGTFAPQCPLGNGKAIPARHSLFHRPAFAKLGENGGFRRRAVHEGRTRSGFAFKEVISIAGRVEEDAVTGAYLRIRTAKHGRKVVGRCVTGPIPFRLARYLPLKPGAGG